MDQDSFRFGMVVTLFAALISSNNVARAETTMETNASQGEVGVISGSVSRSRFTLAVVNREPRERVTELSNNQFHIYFFSELKGLAGQTVSHRWSYQGQNMAEVTFDVGAPRWRVWSSKVLLPEWTGEWTVSVINELGQEIFSDSFQYVATDTTVTP